MVADYFDSSILTPATTNTTANSLLIVIGASRRMPNSDPMSPPASAVGAHQTIPCGTFFTLARSPSKPEAKLINQQRSQKNVGDGGNRQTPGTKTQRHSILQYPTLCLRPVCSLNTGILAASELLSNGSSSLGGWRLVFGILASRRSWWREVFDEQRDAGL